MQTIPQAFLATAQAYAPSAALKVKRQGAWQVTTWAEYGGEVRRAARALIALGVDAGAGVTIIGFNRPEWFVANMAAICVGALPAGIYTTSSPEQCQYITAHCDAAVAFVENAEQLRKYLAIQGELPALKAIVVMEEGDATGGALTWSQFLAKGDAVPQAAVDARMATQQPDDVCALIYTSGTTGVPKAVMLSHDNIIWTTEVATRMAGFAAGDDVISYLPLSHIAEAGVSMYGPIHHGRCVWFAQSQETLKADLLDAQPHGFLGVPRVWEKIQEGIAAEGAKNPPLKKKISAWARKIGLAGGYAEQEKRAKPLLWPLANALVFRKVRGALGLTRARILATSAAPISKDTLEFFLSLGLPICEIYGMSECTGPATMSQPHKYHTGKAGFCLEGAELKIAEDGEICMRGRHVFKGYFKDAENTALTLDSEGWLHSGDIGTIDAGGFLQVTDRKKELIITAGGENVAPQLVEGALKGIPVVSQAMVIGDRRRYISALVTLDPARVPIDAATAGSPARTPEEAAACPKFNAWLFTQVEQVNAKLARVQSVRKVKILPHELTIESGELTPTMKLKRRVILERYAGEVEELYA
ncbi:MAG: dependent ligase [Gemmatimonadetes bacterium]|nr:dependent ligase [Gemmatimonadota bacterium]